MDEVAVLYETPPVAHNGGKSPLEKITQLQTPVPMDGQMLVWVPELSRLSFDLEMRPQQLPALKEQMHALYEASLALHTGREPGAAWESLRIYGQICSREMEKWSAMSWSVMGSVYRSLIYRMISRISELPGRV